ncbi:uncharacterized protein LOC135948881 [Calliphora vicina]|uniref:uncharacterized protein LOC135948881 n=1 Tax=Calliphora vicina TaxID=7373 RepID=UPI00325A7355
MNTTDIGDILDAWNIGHLYDKFKDEKITKEVLKILTPIHIAKLFSDLPVGDQAIFENKLKNWKKSFEADITDIDLLASPKPTRNNISVREVLNTTHNGKEILAFYNNNGTLYDEQRNLLITTITKYVEGNDIDCSLSDCTELEKEICTIFPSEEIEFYRTGKRGKLYNKLANLKRIAKGAFKCKIPVIGEIETEINENYDISVKCLRDEGTTAEDIDIYWRQCAPLRFQQLKNAKKTSDICKLWPEYKKPSAWQLIDIDFKLKFPAAKSLFDRWSQLGDKILYLLKTKVTSAFVSQKLLELTMKIFYIFTESKQFAILWYLHHLFSPTHKINTDPSGSKIRKKFSIADSQHGFAIIADTNEELEMKINLLKLQSRSIQPKLLIVGQLPTIQLISIYFDNYRYKFTNVLNAFDILFKLFFVFNIEYPEESDLFYNFIQCCMYEILLLKKSSKICTIKHELFQSNI